MTPKICTEQPEKHLKYFVSAFKAPDDEPLTLSVCFRFNFKR